MSAKRVSVLILTKNEQQDWLISIETGKQVPSFSSATLQLQAKQLQTNAAIASADWLTNGDVYFHQDAQKTPKVLRITFSDSLKTLFNMNKVFVLYLTPILSKVEGDNGLD